MLGATDRVPVNHPRQYSCNPIVMGQREHARNAKDLTSGMTPSRILDTLKQQTLEERYDEVCQKEGSLMTGEQLSSEALQLNCYEEPVFIRAQGHSRRSPDISTFSHEKRQKGYGQYLCHPGVSAHEGSIKSEGRLVLGGFSQGQRRKSSAFLTRLASLTDIKDVIMMRYS